MLSARALHKTMHTLCKSYHVGPLCIVLWNTGCCSELHCRVALLIGMTDGTTSTEESPDNDSDISHTCTTTGHRNCS